MKQNQFDRILELLHKNGGTVSCAELARHGLYHKAASRCGAEARRKGYVIRLVQKETWDVSYYELISEPIQESLIPLDRSKEQFEMVIGW